ncbi:MAG: aminoglycoside phosphotransferase family protein [Alphaproteobacteria bacterium]|nr:aminoglycoside phosphotransferase family protein [Alphaproteobacteria bacterium]
MTQNINNLIHGRESYVVYFGDTLIMKRPLPTLNDSAREQWLAKQHRTKDAIDEIHAVGNPRYNIPRMIHIKDDEYQLLEECAPGKHLTPALFKNLSRRQQYEIIDGIAAFLVDMNELKPIQEIQRHKIASELKFDRLDKFIENKMHYWFKDDEIKYMASIRDNIGTFEYDTRAAWSHCDLNPGNVLYDPTTSTLSFIDFAEANYRFIYRDIFAPLQIELGICRRVYETYCKLHNNSEYSMPSVNNENLRLIMKYRVMCALLKRFIKASDDLRLSPASFKGIENNQNKVRFMREQISTIMNIDKQFSR